MNWYGFKEHAIENDLHIDLSSVHFAYDEFYKVQKRRYKAIEKEYFTEEQQSMGYEKVVQAMS